MATEPKTVEQDEPTTTSADDNEVAAQLEKVRQILEHLPGLFEDLSSTEQQEEPPIFKSFDLNSAAEHMAKCSNIIVMSGAGISTSAGIPDFRSPDTGLYSQLEKYNLPFPQAIFELGYFRDFSKCDFLIIIGTSLAVAPFNNLISYVDKNCPRLLINMEPVGNTVSFWNPFGSTLMFDSPKNHRDVFHKSTCDEGVIELAKLLGWERDFTTLLQKERKLNLTKTASSTKTVASSTASSTQLNTTATSTKATSSSLKPSNETTRRSISSTKPANITTRNTSSTKAAAAASSKKFPTSTKTTTVASTKKK
ncbi:unnamed protein product [Rotaria sp. Silwood1]|nr:unnamed protein product [Rotaria sp. Silwood1]CAF4727451.1 unnamed protein product [Rotaria sp. Silwood1]CAF4790156.1 unnamed protein product [Rotaria sp. Silwood1]